MPLTSMTNILLEMKKRHYVKMFGVMSAEEAML